MGSSIGLYSNWYFWIFFDFNRKILVLKCVQRRKAGFSDDEFQGIIINDERLLDGQDYHGNIRIYLWCLCWFLFFKYLDANIDAHLLDYNVDENLSFKPFFENTDVYFWYFCW